MINYKKEMETNGGFSFDKNGKAPTSGYMVSVYGTETICALEEVQELAESKINTIKLAEEGRKVFVGGWEHLDKYYIDISYNINNREEALQAAKIGMQKAIYDVIKDEVIYTN